MNCMLPEKLQTTSKEICAIHDDAVVVVLHIQSILNSINFVRL
jgi:hypothetical protein